MTPQRTSEGGAAGEPDGHPPIGDLDALTDCTAITIVNCPSKKPIAAIFGSRISAHVLRESRSGLPESGRVDQDAANAFAAAIFAEVAGRQHLCRN